MFFKYLLVSVIIVLFQIKIRVNNTVNKGIQRQGDEFVKNCIFVEIHHDKESAHDEIKQIVELCDKYMKPSR